MTKVLILNGTSSAGKTTLARALQAILPEAYLLCSLDAFWNMTPMGIPANSDNFPALKQGMARSARALAETGHNVIIDVIFRDEADNAMFSRELDGIDTLRIKVFCPLEELIRREAHRGDRRRGLAQSQFDSAHQDIVYDMEVDTSTADTEACAAVISDFLKQRQGLSPSQ